MSTNPQQELQTEEDLVLEEETMEAALERRRTLPKEDRSQVKTPDSVRKDYKKLAKWSLVCLFQDNPLLVVAAGAILVFEVIKTLVDVVMSFL